MIKNSLVPYLKVLSLTDIFLKFKTYLIKEYGWLTLSVVIICNNSQVIIKQPQTLLLEVGLKIIFSVLYILTCINKCFVIIMFPT